ncbi:polysaccharide biosynthesis tyrosine autokinase [bacterium]|nr:polysaccharide biosynthesis tyrosine autokinase [bacterium]
MTEHPDKSAGPAPWQDPAATTQEGRDLRGYMELVWGRKWLVLFCIVLAFFAGTFYLRRTHPVYAATAVMQFQRESPRVFEFNQGPTQQGANEDLRTQIELIRSPAVAQRVINALDLFAGQSDAPLAEKDLGERLIASIGKIKALFRDKVVGMEAPEIDPETLQRQIRIQSVLDNLKVTQRPKTHLIEVTFYSHDQREAARVADEFCRQFIGFVNEVAYLATETARESAQENIEAVREKLEQAEQDLLDYAVADQKMLEMKKRLVEDRVEDISRRVDELADKTIQAEAEVSGAKMAEDAGVILRENNYISDLRKRLNELQIRRATLLAEAKKDHPELQQVERELVVLNDQLTSAVVGLRIESDVRRAVTDQTLKVQRERLTEAEEELEYLSQSLVKHGALQRDAETYRELYSEMLQRYKEMTVEATMEESPLTVVSYADIPRFPERPKMTRTMAFSIFAGLVLGLLLVFFLEQIDRSVKSPAFAEKTLGLPTLGVVPFLGAPGRIFSRSKGRQIQIVSEMNPKSPQAEAFRYLRTAIQYSVAGARPRVLLVTSCATREGKSTASINLAITLAGRGEKTLLIDADLKKPVVHQTFKTMRMPGLTDVLTENKTIEESIIACDTVADLDLLPAGPSTPSPADMLDSEDMTALLTKLREKYANIVIDSPPLFGMADSYVLATKVDGVCLVIRKGVTRRDVLSKTAGALDNMGVRLLGAIYNVQGRERRSGEYYAYGYYGYGSEGYYNEDDGGEDSPKRRPAESGSTG